MKKFISILLFFAVFAFFGCEDVLNDFKNAGDNLKDNLTDTAEETYLGDTEIPNNKSNSVGTNELKGKTISDGTTKLKFANSYVTKSDDKSGLANARSEDHVAGKMDFTYSYNSNDKTLDFQLNQIWGSGLSTAQTYEKQIEKATETYKSVADKVVESLSNDSLYTTFSTVNLGESVKDIVVYKAKSYIEKQESILSDYLEKKYNAVIKFGYAFDSEESPTEITLTEKFKGDLTDASSKFVYTRNGITIVLNDYDNVTPFKIEIESEDDEGNTEIYVGVPSIEDNTITVSLIPYSGDVLTDVSATISIPTKIYTPIINNLTASIGEKGANIIAELITNKDSDTLKSLIDESIGSQELKAIYKVEDATTNEPAKLVLSFTQVPDYLPNLANASIELTHTPLLGATYDIVK